MKLDAKAKKAIKKNQTDTCAYVYRDGIVIRETDRHIYKGKTYSDDKIHKIPGEIAIHYANGNNHRFEGRFVFHNPTLLLDGIKSIKVYPENSSNRMKEMNLTCTTVTIETESGMSIKFNQFDFISHDITIQDDGKKSIDSWE